MNKSTTSEIAGGWTGGGLMFGTLPEEPFDVMPDSAVEAIVTLRSVADITFVVRDETAERQRIGAAVSEMIRRTVKRGYAITRHCVEWHDYDGRGGGQDRPVAILILMLQHATAEQRREVLLDLLDFLSDQDDAAVRERLSVRVR